MLHATGQLITKYIGLLTKSDYTTKIKTNSWKLYTNNSYIMSDLWKIEKIKCNQYIWVQCWGLILSNSNWNYDVSSITNESMRSWPTTEWIHSDELLFTTTCQSSSTNWPISFSPLQWQIVTGQSNAKNTNCITSS